MAHFIDRRLNPKDRSLGNRRRFIKRVRSYVKQAVNESVRGRDIAEADRGDSISVPAEGIREPSFHHAESGGRRDWVLPGNRSFRAGDRIDKPPGGGRGAGRKGSPDGESVDEFAFVLSREEFLDLFFEDLELPDLVKRSLKEIKATRPRRMGYSVTGSPANLNVVRTMRNALGRRIAIGRPSDSQIDALRQRISKLERVGDGVDGPDDAADCELTVLRTQLGEMLRRQKRIPYLDPLDVRYNFIELHPEPNANAVMFCLMDVSASMGEREKDLAKRFFVLLHMFLSRRYDKVEIAFIRHTHHASEVDEKTFFHSRDTGGTIVSSALIEMQRVIETRYSPLEWNIYAAQASDGENYVGDSRGCAEILNNKLMNLCQYFAYVEIINDAEASFLTNGETGTELWLAYRGVARSWPNFATKRISRPSDIYPVFRELFARKSAGSAVDG